jgi:hypothetical protein
MTMSATPTFPTPRGALATSAAAGAAVALGLAVFVALAGTAVSADKYAVQVPNGIAFSEFRGFEDWATVAVSQSGDLIEVIVANPVMIEAYRAGAPGNGKPFPDGSKMAKIHWNAKKSAEAPAPTLVPDTLHDVDFMLGTARGSPTAAIGDRPSSTMTPRPTRSRPQP